MIFVMLHVFFSLNDKMKQYNMQRFLFCRLRVIIEHTFCVFYVFSLRTYVVFTNILAKYLSINYPRDIIHAKFSSPKLSPNES